MMGGDAGLNMGMMWGMGLLWLLVLVVLLLVALLYVAVETPWAKDEIRALLVRQANQYLTATLQIGRLEGSLLRGLTLRDVRLEQDGRTLIAIDRLSVAYNIREIWSRGIVIDRIHLVEPRISATKRPDGRWDLASIIRQRAQEAERKGPDRSVHIADIQIDRGTIVLHTPVAFGAAHIPSRYDDLNARMQFDYVPVHWTLRFESMSWRGSDPDLTITSLTGGLGHGPGGFTFDRLGVVTPSTRFTLSGSILSDRKPTVLDLTVHADRMPFQEWSGIIHGLRNIAVRSAFDVRLQGPVTALDTTLGLRSDGGDISGRFLLNTQVPGWRGNGAVDVKSLNLARWLNRSDRPSDITGHVVFNLALRLGQGFPQGPYQFRGPHAAFMEYAADNIAARGTITLKEALIDTATARAYGSDVTASGAIGIDAPYTYRFRGTIVGLDLRRVPLTVPVPHVESTLAFDYDVNGTFSNPFIAGHARLARSVFLGATIDDGTVGSIDTSAHPLRYSGEGVIEDVDLHRFGVGLDIAVLREPRYAALVSGRFNVHASGTTAAELVMHATGHLRHATAFGGTLTDADVGLEIADGTVRGSYSGRFADINPAIPLLDERYAASLTGNGTMRMSVRDLLLRTASAADYDIDGNVTLGASTVRGLRLDRGHAIGGFHGSLISLTAFEAAGPAATVSGDGTLAFGELGVSDFDYTVSRADLAVLGAHANVTLAGTLMTTGRLSGPFASMHLDGNATLSDFSGYDVTALTASGHYAVTLPADPVDADVRVTANATFASLFGQTVQQISGTITLAQRRAGFDLTFAPSPELSGRAAGRITIGEDVHALAVDALSVTVGRSSWRLLTTGAAAQIHWDDGGVTLPGLTFAGGSTGAERVTIGGNWRRDGSGALRMTAENVNLEELQHPNRPARYGGLLNADATLRGTAAQPIVSGTVSVTSGRVEKVSFERLAGSVQYSDQIFTVDVRLDQAPGVWATAQGRLPLALFRRSLPERPIDVRVITSPIQLGLLEGLTSVVTNVSGRFTADVRAIGTSRDPHFAGRVNFADASFTVASTGARYTKGGGQITLAREQITVDTFHLEDSDRHPLDLHGSLGTHELKVGDLEIDATSNKFTVLQNELGRVQIDSKLRFRGQFESPVVEGDLTVSSGTLNVDTILEETLFRPYSTVETTIPSGLDPLVALNPWERMRLNLALHVPNTLKLQGENVQVSPGTPIGLGDINLRVGGDLYLLKEAARPLEVYGSFDEMTGTYSFQGRRFDLAPQTSSINFRGALSPELYVSVARDISGVEARVTITGSLSNPELHLSSTPPLETSDILSLIVFNASMNDLTASQQQELAVRAGALAAGFLATPLVSAVEGALGLEALEIAPSGDFGNGPKVTIGEEIAPGLVARFSRQFGVNEYNQVEIVYILSRILQIRATFSDAASVNLRSPFRRIERGGIDLLVYFSF